jgi:hypothetical protein
LDRIANWIKTYGLDGIYAENYGGVVFAEENGVKLFAGTGFNLTNEYSVVELLRCPSLSYYSISKELNEIQAKSLVTDKAFALSSGSIKLMDLCYCPFGKTCNKCDKLDCYMLIDENGRNFPARRYLSADGNCRFEVYNCADLIGTGIVGVGKLVDVSVLMDKQQAVDAKDNEIKQKGLYKSCTSGHYKRGVL